MPMIRLLIAATAMAMLAGCSALGCGVDGGSSGYEAVCNAEIHF